MGLAGTSEHAVVIVEATGARQIERLRVYNVSVRLFTVTGERLVVEDAIGATVDKGALCLYLLDAAHAAQLPCAVGNTRGAREAGE
jgi:hypothetical protein